jgi:virginiamycin A acetyltransferase
MKARDGRELLKRVAFGTCLLVVSPLIALAWTERKLPASEGVFSGLSQLLSLLPGLPGTYLRGAFYFATLDDCSWRTHVGFGTIVSHRAAALGSNVTTGAYCILGHARIGDGVRLASRVSIPSGRRQHLDSAGQLSSGPARFDRVTIGPGSWVGEGAIIMADVGSACIVSAGSVVGKPVPDGCLVGGNPARVIRELCAADIREVS